MIRFNARTKSAVLACAMMVSAQSSCVELSNPFSGIGSCLTANKVAILPFTAALLLALKVRLDTKPRGTYNYDNWQDDVLDLLSSYNILSASSRATIMNFIDKYFVGAKLRLDDSTIRVKEEDGSVVTTKRKKLTQKPSGAMGLFDAYVLQQLEADNKLLAELAAMYILITTPKETWESALKKIMGESYVNIH